jgi:hypothetical protein
MFTENDDVVEKSANSKSDDEARDYMFKTKDIQSMKFLFHQIKIDIGKNEDSESLRLEKVSNELLFDFPAGCYSFSSCFYVCVFMRWRSIINQFYVFIQQKQFLLF